MGLHVYGFGPADGHPLVALHGLKGYGGRWREVAGLLLTCRVYAPDLRGVGQSPQEPPWTMEQHATDVLGVLDAAGLDRADIVGHSFGGAVAVALARLAPERVRRMVLLDPSLAVPPDVALRHAMREFDVPSFADPDEAAAARSSYWPESASHLVPDEVREHLAQDADGRWRWRYNVAMAVSAFSELARPDLTPPPGIATLVVRASLGSVPPAQIAGWASAPGVDLSAVELHCGHMVYLERPTETAALIERFLDV
jgi:lipase